MMKTKTYWLLFAVFLFVALKSTAVPTDTLFLDVKGTAGRQVFLKLKGRTLRINDNLNPSSATWVLHVTKVKEAAVALINTEGNDVKSLEDIAISDYDITNSKLSDAFTIGSNFRILILKKSGNDTIKTFQLTYSPGAAPKRDNPDKAPPAYIVGSPVYDAYTLTKESNAFKTLILIHYSAHPQSETLIADDYKDNPFLDSIAKSLINAKAESSLSLSSVLSSVGGLDVTTVADGLAKFIVKRTKQELSISFFQKFKDVIDKTPDIATIFPQTASLLLVIDNEIYDYQRYLQNLREAFKKDITEIHRNLPGIVDNHPVFFSKHQPVKAALLSACYTAVQLEDEAHPGDILANYPLEYLDPDSLGTKNYRAAIQTVQLISASLKDTSTAGGAKYWAGIEQIRKLVNNKEVFKMYLGLLYQEARFKYDSIRYDKTDLLVILDKVAKDYEAGFSIYNSYRSYILRFGEKVVALNQMIKEHSKEDLSDSARVEKYVRYFRTSVDLIEYSTAAFKLPGIKNESSLNGFDRQLSKYFNIAYAAADLTAAINRKNYSAAINNAVNIYTLVTVKAANDPSLSSATTTANVADEPGSDVAGFSNTGDKLIRYGSFMATVATAKSSDEVAAAIETAALPVGSARMKRVAIFNVALNAYCGLFVGHEKIKNVEDNHVFNAYGITAPIGVSTSWGGKCGWSHTAFISLIDLGAVTAFRFTDETTEQVPTIQLKDIVSPGAFYSLGIAKTPLSVNIGAQVGPNLRRVKDTSNDYSDKTYIRYSLSFCVDIPLFNFYTKSR